MFCISEPFKETLVPSIWTNTVYETSSALDIVPAVTSPISKLTTIDEIEIFTIDPKVTTRSSEVTTAIEENISSTEVHEQIHKTTENSTPSTNTELISSVTVETEANITSKTENDTKEWDSREKIIQNYTVYFIP